MKDIPEFRIDRWIQAQIDKIKIPLQGSNIGAWSLSELQQLDPDEPILDYDLPLTYGTSAGSVKLRERIAALYSSPENGVTLTADNIVVTPGSIMANYLALTNLAGPGDHVICLYPTFSQLFAVPRFQGADVSLWRLRKRADGSGWYADLDDLKALLRENTRVIIINNPNNPTGAVLPHSTLAALLHITSTTHQHTTLYSDEVFHPLFHAPGSHPPSLLSLPTRTRTIVTGSLSKTLGLPGLRLGWIACNDATFLRARVMKARDYTTISVAQLSDAAGCFALGPRVMARILERSHEVRRRGC
ncbi:pyridoxal phosphate-dependent transferase [Schizothecium vesticola]|uniref:Pyridoxal phosphate-dependent transferase n=1 Tax=Schizothecium vesticola TaxID=314040 RepID=A0AA40FAW3_9PEZI|nr:pyridoxal phosphate-dependent transferase [Schizothecium vesticola]